ncbi:MAG TPA: CPBP family glutamic-type intramembrane protease [Phycisphaerales bacterium]|nr:CPBP family glutamic-type intramembrane protease [Phycisphaerales bacterium]
MSRARSTSRTPMFSKPLGKKDTYAHLSTRPLHVLAFLAPLMVLYEVGSILYLSDSNQGVMETIAARRILGGFFELFGQASFHLPPIVLAVVLLVWHYLERDSWRLKPSVLLGMLLESCLWVLPIIVLGYFLGSRTPAAAAAFSDYTREARITLAIGAGLYEELLFRLILITALHLVLVDLMKLKSGTGFAFAAVASAVAFALYHDVARRDTMKLLFLAGAGGFFAVLYILRGFGVVVATHALYDVVVLVGMSQDSSS